MSSLLGAGPRARWATSSYRSLLVRSGAAGIATWSLLGRLAFAMGNLSLLLYVHAVGASLALAGAAGATNLLGTAITAVAQGRWFDRHGVRRTLCLLTAAYVPLTALVLALVESGQPAWILLTAILAQSLSTPLMGVATRAMLPHLAPLLAPDAATRAALFRYWTISFELCYVVAPALTALLGAMLSTRAPFILSAVLLAVASLGYAALPAIGDHRGCPTRAATSTAPHSRSGLVTLVIAALGFGTVVGFVVITTTATATALGHAPAIGLLFTLMTISSVAGGLVSGRGNRFLRRESQLPLLILTSACALLIPLTGQHILALALCVIVAGATFTPQLTLQSIVLDDVVPHQRVGAAFGWLTTAVAIGNGAGQALGGSLSQHFTPDVAASAGALIVAAVATAVWLRRRTLASDHRVDQSTPNDDDILSGYSGEVQRSGSGDFAQRSPAVHHGGAVTIGMHLLEQAGPWRNGRSELSRTP